MNKGILSAYFEGVVAKRLSGVEVNPVQSNQHEFNGGTKLKQLLGAERLEKYPTRFIYFGDHQERVFEKGFLTWYDAREDHPTRTEHRLYFNFNQPMSLARPGDLLLVIKTINSGLMVIVASEGSTNESQLVWLFGLSNQIETKFEYTENIKTPIDFSAKFVLNALEVEIEETESDRLDLLLEPFHGVLPSTTVFSDFVRSSLPHIEAQDDPDTALIAWLEQEEKLFRRMEYHQVAARLKTGFIQDNIIEVDAFIHYSLQVQNRRKSRMGHSLENHLKAVFHSFKLQFDSQGVTENKKKPDFLFPSQAAYHDPQFPIAKLAFLGAKSTCKDRWRQVLSEAKRIPNKHLLTLEPSISVNQTGEMQASNLQLVLPQSIHKSYHASQQDWLINLSDFIKLVQKHQ